MNHRRLNSMSVLLVMILLAVTSARADLDNKGKDFIMAFLPNISEPATELHLTSDVTTTVTVEYPVNSPTFHTTVTVTAGEVTIVEIPNTASQIWYEDEPMNNCVHAFADQEFVAYMINRSTYTSDACLALPTDVLNTQYIAITYVALFEGDSEFAIFAAYDNTTITITPSKELVSGQPGGEPFTVVLDRGQAYFNRGSFPSVDGDLTGTIVSADKPIGMINGNSCATVPEGTIACDHVFEMAQPVQTWGHQVLAANLPNRTEGSIYRIVASEDATTVTRNGVEIGTIDRGQFIETDILPGNHVFEANHPIFVTQFMTGAGRPGTNDLGDPAMGNLAPSEQYFNEYTFSTVGGDQFAENFVTVIGENADIGSNLMLDGALIPSDQFTAIPGTDFSAAVISITSGTHTTSSTGVHGITVSGMNSFDSYLYPGGSLFRFINPLGDNNPPEVTLTVSGGTATGTATDNRTTEDVNGNGILDPGEDLNNNGVIDFDNGIYLVELGAGSQNLELAVDPFDPGASEVMFTVSLIAGSTSGNGSVVVTDGGGNTVTTPISLTSNQPPVANAGPDQTVEVTSTLGATVTLDGTGSSDPDGNVLTYQWLDQSGMPIGTTAMLAVTVPYGTAHYTLIVDDGNGETSADDVIITVIDTQAPVPAVATLPTVTGEASAMITSAPTANDVGVGEVTGTTTDPLTYTTQGTFLVHWTFDDGRGNVSTQTQTVSVHDETPPVLTVELDKGSCWPPNHKLKTVAAIIHVDDNVDSNPTIELVSVTSSEVDDGCGDGHTNDDIQGASIGTDDRFVKLRCERSGNATGRVYTLTYSATDAAGNSTTASATFSVSHDQSNNEWCSNNSSSHDDHEYNNGHDNDDDHGSSRGHDDEDDDDHGNGSSRGHDDDDDGDHGNCGSGGHDDHDDHGRYSKSVYGSSDYSNLDGVILNQNTPNPMVNETEISFELPRATEIQLTIYNMQGKVIRTLASGPYNGGAYSVHWDGRDENGLLMPSGSYFYRLRSSECGCDDAKELIIRR